MGEILELAKNPIGALALAVAGLTLYIIRKRDKKDLLREDEDGAAEDFRALFFRRAEARFAEIHKLASSVTEATLLAQRAEQLAKQASERIEHRQDDLEETVRELFVLKERVEGLIRREEDHYKEGMAGRKEIMDELRILRNLLTEMVQFQQHAREARALVGK